VRWCGAGCSRLTATLVALLLLAYPVTARADADPASDFLLAQDAFYPYLPRVPPQLEATLNGLLVAAARARLPLKVAIIGSPLDLGAIPNFFGHPQPYAEFLEREISFSGPQPLLVVMPAGFGVAGAGPRSALADVSIDSSERTYGLTRSAILAVVALARADGRQLALPRIPAPPNPQGGVPSAVVLGLPAAVLIVICLAVLRRRTRSRASRAASSPPPASSPPSA
jgi:hypothetical protein